MKQGITAKAANHFLNVKLSMPGTLRVLATLLLAAACLPASADPPPPMPVPTIRTSWIPGNAGVLSYGGPIHPVPMQPVGEAGGSVWLTRRIVASPYTPTSMIMGSFLNGVYVSQTGGAWISATPGCLLPYTSPVGSEQAWDAMRAAAVLASGLDACGIEGLAFDPDLPNRIYASGYDAPTLSTLNPGGVYVSDNGGFTWRKLLGGIRGAGLAVTRPGNVLSGATIVAGYIQQSNAAVGSTPGNGSLSISNNDGRSWRSVVLPASGCPDGVGTSQRLTATVAVNAADPRIIYAGTNAGLYVSSDTGATWRLARVSCGGMWGIGPAPDGRVFLGDNTGNVYEADAAVNTIRPIVDVGAGYVQSIEADPFNANTIYAAVWSGAASRVYRITVSTGLASSLYSSALFDLGLIPQPFPFSFAHNDGTAPSLFLARVPGRLYVSTILRGTFLRGE